MSAYTNYPGQFIRIPNTDYYTATLPLVWDIGKYGSGVSVPPIPTEFRHDVSVPWFLTFIFNRHDPRFQRAARLHDWLLTQEWSAWTSSAIFYDALKADGTKSWERWSMALAVLLHIAKKAIP